MFVFFQLNFHRSALWLKCSTRTSDDARMQELQNRVVDVSSHYKDNIKIPANQDIEITSNFENINQLGITESELDQQCDELFRDTPIVFEPRKDD